MKAKRLLFLWSPVRSRGHGLKMGKTIDLSLKFNQADKDFFNKDRDLLLTGWSQTAIIPIKTTCPAMAG